MKLQGVNILRITDFRRFFDYTEFENQKKEFVKLLKSENYNPQNEASQFSKTKRPFFQNETYRGDTPTP